MLKDTCFFYDANEEKCTALKMCQCIANKPCPFHQTHEQHLVMEQEVYARIRTLPDETQQMIAENCYAGSMPWREAIA